ncbi:MAG: hypothetical protein ACLUSP_00535 [Christensenellales bacterium]
MFPDGTVVTLIYDADGRQDRVSVAVRETLELMQKYLKTRAYCGVSGEFTSAKHVNRGYKEALLAMNELKNDDGEIRYVSDVEFLSAAATTTLPTSSAKKSKICSSRVRKANCSRISTRRF